MNKNIILIGMPGSGKSTIGVILAKALGYGFIDTDIVIQNNEKTTLQTIINSRGLDAFISIENYYVKNLKVEKNVVATGGSVVLEAQAMENLKKLGTVVYLDLSEAEVEKRLANIKTRGVVIREGQSIAELFAERKPLYEKYAQVTVKTDGLSVEEAVEEIIRRM